MDILTFIFILIVFFILFILIRRHYEKIEIKGLDRKAVLITGCDTGFGYLLVLKCTSRGIPVFAGCLTEKGADNLRKASRNMKGELIAFTMDVTNDESVKKTKEMIEEKTKKYGGLHALVNNAGIASKSFSDDMLTIDDYQTVFNVNTLGVIRVTQAMKGLIKKARGRIVTVASICARVTLPGLGPYTVSKFAVSAYCDTIRQELRPFDVSVHILEPGFFKTTMVDTDRVREQLKQVWDNCSSETKMEYGEEFVNKSIEKSCEFVDRVASDNVELVVEAYFHALTAKYPRLRYQIGWDSILLFIPISFLPTYLLDLLYQLSDKLRGEPLPIACQRL